MDNFRLRSEARRAVMGLVVDHELELTEIRIRQLDPVIDIFVILEASVSSGWDLLQQSHAVDEKQSS